MRKGIRIQPIPILLGPTATGKSAVAIALAQRLNGEILCADARTVYVGMDVGTAKPTAHERALVPHHLLDICDPTEVYDAQRFRQDVSALIPSIQARGKRPIIVGGTTLYVQALTEGLFEGVSADRALRKKLNEMPLEQLYTRLQAVDPQAALDIKPNDRIRITRALEVFEKTGQPISQLQQLAQPLPYVFKKFGLTLARATLYERINRRVDWMIEQGLVEEARRLHPHLTPDLPAYKTIGYQELFEHFDGKCSLEQAIGNIKQHTRNYAKRQLTWHRRDSAIVWIDVERKIVDEIVVSICRCLNKIH